jgi:hypothetical protein
MPVAIAVLLALHGVAHFVGFLGPWGMAGNVPVQTSLFAGRFQASDGTLKALGILWLLVGLTFIVCAIGELRHASWWSEVTLNAAVLSLLLSISSFPASKIGIPINVVIIATLLFAQPLTALVRKG